MQRTVSLPRLIAQRSSLRHALWRLCANFAALFSHTRYSPRTTPYLDERGRLMIPTNSDPTYYYWKGGQSVVTTLKELGAPLDVIRRFMNETEFEKLQAKAEKSQAQIA